MACARRRWWQRLLLIVPALLASGSHADIVKTDAGQVGSNPADLIVAGEFLYFTADDGISGRELWRLGEDQNPALVADIMPGPEGSEPFMLRAAGEVLYFFTRRYGSATASNATTLWATRGTTDTTRMLLGPMIQIEPLQAEGIGEDLLFAAPGSGVGRELWHGRWSTGTYDLFHEFIPGAGDGFYLSVEHRWIASDNAVLLTAFGDLPERPFLLWRCSVSPKEVVALKDSAGVPLRTEGVLHGDTGPTNAYFMTTRNGWRVWIADMSLESQFEATQDRGFMWAGDFTAGEDGCWVQARDEANGPELWRTRGASVELVADIVPGGEGSTPYFLIPLGSGLVFVADHPDYGTEPWYSDGTAAGTRIIRDMMPGPTDGSPYQLCRLGDFVFFSCENDAYGEELWRTDGTDAGTWLVKDINQGPPDGEPYYLTPFQGQVYFSATNRGAGAELWVSDGTPEGTRMAAQLRPPLRNVQSSAPANLTAIGDTLYFTAVAPGLGRELWASDGSEAGTRCIADIVPGAAGSAPRELQAIDGILYFHAVDQGGQEREWAWDPETQMVEERIAPVLAPAPTLRETLPPECLAQLDLHDESDWAALGENLIFAARDPQRVIEPWIFNAARGECRLLADLFTGPASSVPTQFVASEGRVCFAAYSLPSGREFWETDGTAEGTRQARDFLRFPRSASPTGLVAWHEGVAFLHRNAAGVPIVHYEPTLNKAETHFLWNFG
ncbi:MAG: hypothetical protein IT368_02875, partial [Candidatus Hydrogenedentes bacterium]|nr:hypothetical protein [Candidatus Hydrogenedentota bacterium]